MSSSGLKILIVDDEPLNLEIISEFLEDSGYELEKANDGLEAWEKLSSNPRGYQTVVLDRMMPKMDGMELLKRMKGVPALDGVPVVMQTAAASTVDVVSGLNAGVFYYLTKPFEEEVLRSIVDAAVSDYDRYCVLQDQVKGGAQVMELMTSGHLEFKTIDEARNIASFLAKACPEPERVVSGLSELLLNSVEHGNLGITYDEKSELNREGRWRDEVYRRQALPENSDKAVNVDFEKHEDKIVIRITDQGQGFDWKKYLEMDAARVFHTHGRGIAMAKRLSFDDVRYLGPGNQVEADIKIG